MLPSFQEVIKEYAKYERNEKQHRVRGERAVPRNTLMTTVRHIWRLSPHRRALLKTWLHQGPSKLQCRPLMPPFYPGTGTSLAHFLAGPSLTCAEKLLLTPLWFSLATAQPYWSPNLNIYTIRPTELRNKNSAWLTPDHVVLYT